MKIKEIRDAGVKLGFREIQTINVNSHLNGTRGKATLLPDGWELTESGREYLLGKGCLKSVTALTPLLRKVEQYVTGITLKETKEFINESIECANRQLYRAAVVLSWIGAVSILHHYVLKNYLTEFNKEAIEKKLIKKPIKNQDGLTKIGENDFLQVIQAI
ncbi:MAG: hypothetical protein FJX46_05565 [Alphaproteobacteria bacterium]|nr:hypothetical protein [Alphaproteobacteria bacterium]